MSKPTLEERIGQWRNYLEKWPAVRPADIDELEDHLRSQIEALRQAGLDEDEAFLVAVKRLGDLDAISREFAIEYSERLWKQLVVIAGSPTSPLSSQRDTMLAVRLAVASAVAIKIPSLFGYHLSGPPSDLAFYLPNLSLFVLPFLAIFFGLKRGLRQLDRWFWLAIPFIAAGLLVNLMPFKAGGQTQVLTAIHLPIALWLMLCYAYAGGSGAAMSSG